MILARSLLALLSFAVLVGGASADVEWNTTSTLLTGTVVGNPESVAFTGVVRIQSRLAVDPENSRRNKLLLQIDMGGVSGVGVSTLSKYVVESQDIVTRRLAALDVVQITFPFHASNVRAVGGSRTGMASFALTVDTATGAVKTATGTIVSLDLR